MPDASRGLNTPGARQAYEIRLFKILAAYVVGLLGFLLLMGWAEQQGLSRRWIGPIFLFSSVMVCAGIGIYCRTTDAEDYYVAGRRIPAFFNGMASAADWMSAASFISLAGALYLQGFSGSEAQPGGLAYVLGWTGGFCLVAMLIAPYLRRAQLYTLPDFFDRRFGGRWPRVIAALAAVACSFTYVVAQIYGVGLIASRLTGVQFEIGIMLGLGGVLLCSFLGGMRAITWTQVAQYIILLLAFLIPVSWLAYKQLGNPLAPLVYGQQLAKIEALEQQLMASPAEQEVAAIYLRRAREYESYLENIDAALIKERKAAQDRLRQLRQQNADVSLIVAASRDVANVPHDAATAREQWTRAIQESRERALPLAGMPPHSRPFAGDPDGTPAEQQTYDFARRNFLALMFCLMMGTAGLPHLLTRYYTTPSVAEARTSVAWSLVFIALLYVSAPALAVLVKFEVMNNLVGSTFESLPPWIVQWSKVDPALVSVSDVNGDGLLQFGELRLGADIVMLAMPELGGLPYVLSGLVAAGGLAAALSTADGLLLTISNSLVRDLRLFRAPPKAGSEERRVILSKFVLLAVAMLAAFVAALKPSEILPLVSASFSLAASALVPAMVLGIFWRRTSRQGAIVGMLAGLGVTVYYLLSNSPTLRALLGLPPGPSLWLGIQPVSAGVFGVPVGLAVTWLISWLGPRETGPALDVHA
ncbi:VC_2705 family sodium/solute symporter [Curvibacter sp. HBC61]|uniref:VC_2705 family sodium/solute symporter n=1 Tax=Curvibacter cyanobacteriorum TaxID=3026422 RepID=A0ABT5MX07_9BURK|nr:VC_2705 family sodium/solute symporter [Curvibacter sp. HBC61]MDD0838589.1 VC_2705 family sodium/solute symporter [Curvibacter sp. HBC61]